MHQDREAAADKSRDRAAAAMTNIVARRALDRRLMAVLATAILVIIAAGACKSTADQAPAAASTAASTPSPTPAPSTSPAANIPALGFVFVPAGPSRAETLREVERQTGVRLSIPWLPDGMEVTGVRVGVGPEPSRVRTAEISVAGQGKGFGMDQTDRPSDFGDGVPVAGAPVGWTFVRADGGAATSWGLSSDKVSWTLSDSPTNAMDDATVLRILLGLAGRTP
ncbi:MAG: hypothetical protein U0547_05000 [Dehalococcoidia bacterium]